MFVVIAAMGVNLAALQATINVPRDAFRSCLKEASAAARTESVKADEFETYARSKCSVQMGSLKSALVAFSIKNGMARKTAASDADLTIDDYVASPVDHYKFTFGPTDATAAASPSPPKP